MSLKGDTYMIGLDINLKNASDRFIYKIFDGIDLSKYTWEIYSDFIMYTKDGVDYERLFGCDVLDGENFLKCISEDSYYMIFADIKAYPVGSNRVDIETYNDYINSECEIVFLCSDSTFVEFYSKDMQILEKVHKNCVRYKFEKAEFFTEEDDQRTVMHVE